VRTSKANAMDISPAEMELRRLEALRRTRLLDTDSDQRFERFVQLAAQIFGTPTALVSLVDEKRQWFKARFGLEVSETARSVAFCSHTIMADAPLIVEDALYDPRFSCNPLVLGEPHIRFYAGAPLITSDGFRLGSLCVIDTVPRFASSTQIQALTTLAAMAADLIECELQRLSLMQQAEAARVDVHDRPLVLASFENQLRNPLDHILGFADIIAADRSELGGMSRVRHFARIIRQSAEQLARVVNAVTRMEKAALGFDVAIREVDIQDSVTSAALQARGMLAAKGQTLNLSIGEGDMRVLADEAAVREILLHLLSNASRYSPHGSTVTASLSSGPYPGRCMIKVEDTGSGFPDDLVSQLQAPLFQPSALGSPQRGSLGIGLRLSKHLAVSMNARLDVRSKAEGGTIASLSMRSAPESFVGRTPARSVA
jgi:two-component system, sensor histidine kinase